MRLRADIRILAENPLDTISTRLGNVSTWRSVSGGSGSEVDTFLEAQTTPDDPASGSAVWSDWRRVDSSEVQARGIRARAKLRARDASFTPAVDRLRVIVDEVV